MTPYGREKSRARLCTALVVMYGVLGLSCRRASAPASGLAATGSPVAAEIPARPGLQFPLVVPEWESSPGAARPPRFWYSHEHLLVEGPVPADAFFPLEQGLMIDDPIASPGDRYFVIDDYGISGALELTAETCPTASDGTVQRCLWCGEEEQEARFARWVDRPTRLKEAPAAVLLGPIDAESLHKYRGLHARPCAEDKLPEPWVCNLAVDVDVDGVVDLLWTYMRCEGDSWGGSLDSRCFDDETWSRTGTRWLAVQHRDESIDEPAVPDRRPLPGLDLFSARIQKHERFDVDLSSATFTGRVASPGGTLLMLDTGGPLASLIVGPLPETDTQTAMYLHRPEREPQGKVFAIGPVHGSWDELARTRVRSDYPGGYYAYEPHLLEFGEHTVLAVDLDDDGVDELELIVHRVVDLSSDEQRAAENYEVWTSEGMSRSLRGAVVLTPPFGTHVLSCSLW